MPWLPWPVNWKEIIYLLKTGWYDFTGTAFGQIKFTDINLALYVVAGLAALPLLNRLLSKLWSYLFGRNRRKHSQKVSGHFNTGRGFIAGTFLRLPKIAIAIPLAAALFAIANPFFPTTRDEKKYIETRIRVDIRDVSGSMAAVFGDTKKSRAEIASDAHLQFLRMRAGKGDRTSFWLFSNNPLLIQSFTVDEDVYYQQVFDAPWEVGSMRIGDWSEERWVGYAIPKSRYAFSSGEGGTVMSTALRAVVDQFNEDEKIQKRSPFYKVVGRSVLILTDAYISDFEYAKIYIDELRKKRVVIYIILVDETYSQPQEGGATTLSPVLQEIIRNGGRYFPVQNKNSLLQAYQEIDKLEKTKIEIEKKVYKIPLFYKFIFIAILALIIIVPVGLFSQLFEHP